MQPKPLDSQDGHQECPAALAINTTLMVFSRALACLTQPGPPGGGLSIPTPPPPARGHKELRWPFVRPQGHTRALRATEGMESGAGVGGGVGNLLAWRPQAPAHMAQAWWGPHPVPKGEAQAGPGCPGCFAGVYGWQDSICVQSRLRFWGLGGNGWVDKRRGGGRSEWPPQTAFRVAKLPSSPALGPGHPRTSLLAWWLLLFIPRVFPRKGGLT